MAEEPSEDFTWRHRPLVVKIDGPDQGASEVVQVTCCECGEPVTVPAGPDGLADKHAGPPYHHDGCAGYPFCSCEVPHKGDCTPETMTKRAPWRDRER